MDQRVQIGGVAWGSLVHRRARDAGVTQRAWLMKYVTAALENVLVR